MSLVKEVQKTHYIGFEGAIYENKEKALISFLKSETKGLDELVDCSIDYISGRDILRIQDLLSNLNQLAKELEDLKKPSGSVEHNKEE